MLGFMLRLRKSAKHKLSLLPASLPTDTQTFKCGLENKQRCLALSVIGTPKSVKRCAGGTFKVKGTKLAKIHP